MDNASEKIPDRLTEIENNVLVGKVLDEHGAWIPIADKKAAEETFVAHLSAGKVLHGGRWVTIGEAKSAQRAVNSSLSTTTLPSSAGPERLSDRNGTPIDFAPETAAIAIEFPPEGGVEYPPETKKMFITPPESAREATGGVDPISGYAVETGLYTIERPAEGDARPANPDVAAGSSGTIQDETKRMPTRRLSSPPSAPSWEVKSGRRAKRYILIGAIIGTLIGGGAIALLFIFGAK